jgi:hypothetical protein
MHMKTLLFVLLIQTVAFAQTHQFENEIIAAKVDAVVHRAEKVRKSNGLLSTIKFGLNINKYAADKKVSDILTIDSHSFAIGGKEFKVETAHSIVNPMAPTVIGHFGFSGDIHEGNAKWFALNFQKRFPQYNLLLIQTMPSNTFSLSSCYYSLGGIDDAYGIVSTTNDFFNKHPELKRELIIIGGSSSSAGIFHSSVYLNKNDFEVKRLFLQSGYNNMARVFRSIRRISRKKKLVSFKNRIKDKIKMSQSVLAKAMLSARLKDFMAQDECEDYLSHRILRKNKITYYDLLVNTFEQSKESLQEIYQMFYPERRLVAPNLEGYLKELSIDRYKEELSFNMLWLHSKDDPLSPMSDIYLAHRRMGESENFHSVILPYGGHSAYKEVYGEKWLNDILAAFIETVLI